MFGHSVEKEENDKWKFSYIPTTHPTQNSKKKMKGGCFFAFGIGDNILYMYDIRMYCTYPFPGNRKTNLD